jgi:hypothetical protein
MHWISEPAEDWLREAGFGASASDAGGKEEEQCQQRETHRAWMRGTLGAVKPPQKAIDNRSQ